MDKITMQTKTVLITGGTGFAGSNLARRLVHEGWDVHLITTPHSRYELVEDIADKIQFHLHDGSTEGMQALMQTIKPIVVFHLASLFLSEHTPEQIDQLVRSNVLFGTQLVEAMAVCGVPYLVNTGTSWEHYGNSSYSPVNLYAATKQAFEAILQYYLEARNLRIVTLKLFDTYGVNDLRPKLFSLLRRVGQGSEALAMSPGEQMIDLVYIDDVVEAFCLAAERLMQGAVKSHERYAVSSGAPLRLREFVTMYEGVIGKKLPIVWGTRPYRLREVMLPWNKGESLPGWLPKVCLEDGIRLTCSFEVTKRD